MSRKVGAGEQVVPGIDVPGAASRKIFSMTAPRLSGKPCPICGVALVRVPTDGCSLVFRCYSCKTEVIKPIPRDGERRRIPVRRRAARFRG